MLSFRFEVFKLPQPFPGCFNFQNCLFGFLPPVRHFYFLCRQFRPGWQFAKLSDTIPTFVPIIIWCTRKFSQLFVLSLVLVELLISAYALRGLRRKETIKWLPCYSLVNFWCCWFGFWHRCCLEAGGLWPVFKFSGLQMQKNLFCRNEILKN